MRHTSTRFFVAAITLTAFLAPSLALATTASSQSTPAADPATPSTPPAQSVRTSTESPGGGFVIEHEPTWLTQADGATILLIPSLENVDENDPEFYAASSSDCADPSKLADDAGFDAMLRTNFQGLTKIVRKGSVERRADGVMSASYDATDESSRTRPVCVAGRIVGGKFVVVLALCSDASLAARSATARTLCESVRALSTMKPTDPTKQPGGAADTKSDAKNDATSDAKNDATSDAKNDATSDEQKKDAIAADGTMETLNELGGYAFRHDATWRRETDGPATIVLASMPATDGDLAEFYAVTGVAWSGSGPLTDNENALNAARQLLGSVEIEREGDVEQLPGGGMLFRSSVPVPDGTRIQVRVLARVENKRLVGIGLMAKQADVARQEEVARRLFQTVRFVPVKEPVGAADPEFVGKWSSEEVLAAGGGFDAGGAATMVTERVLELAADGRFTVSDRSAGSGPGATFDSPAKVMQYGTWSVFREGSRAFLELRSADGSSTKVRCAIFEGKLVLGEPGQRKFFTRVQ